MIFLNPRVLRNNHFILPDQSGQFDAEACELFQNLLQRIKNVAIVLIIPYYEGRDSASSLPQLKEAYQNLGFGDKIIGKIDDMRPLIGTRRLVHDWLFANQIFSVQSFVILDHKIHSLYWIRSIYIKNMFKAKHAEKIQEVLSRPFCPDERSQASFALMHKELKNLGY
jgi:hypothetical protein